MHSSDIDEISNSVFSVPVFSMKANKALLFEKALSSLFENVTTISFKLGLYIASKVAKQV